MTSRGRVCPSGTHGGREARRIRQNRTIITMLTLLLSNALHPFTLGPGLKVLTQGWTSCLLMRSATDLTGVFTVRKSIKPLIRSILLCLLPPP